MTIHITIQAMNNRLISDIASTPGQRAGFVGLTALHIMGGIVALIACGAIFVGGYKAFAWAWKHVPWLIVLWGLSGICLLTIAYIYASQRLYWVGGTDLGIFLVVWFFAAYNQAFD